MSLSVHIAFSGGQKGRDKACGIVMVETETHRTIRRFGYRVEKSLSAESAQYDALLRAVEAAVEQQADDVVFHCPAQWLIDQITGVSSVGETQLESMLERVQASLLKLDLWRLGACEPEGLRLAEQAAREELQRTDGPSAP